MATWKDIQNRIDPLNLNKGKVIYQDHDPYQMPYIYKQDHNDIQLQSFNYKGDITKYAHFFLDDYQFERVWNTPKKYLTRAFRYKGLLTPDFSLYTDYPIAIQIWNTYRNRWCGQYWQMKGCKVIPTISWSTKESYDFCFNGIEKGSKVAISNIGVINNKENLKLFYQGYYEMIKQIEPEEIILYGYKPMEKLNVTFIENRRFKDGRSREQ